MTLPNLDWTLTMDLYSKARTGSMVLALQLLFSMLLGTFWARRKVVFSPVLFHILCLERRGAPAYLAGQSGVRSRLVKPLVPENMQTE
jgi:hypothetical protein